MKKDKSLKKNYVVALAVLMSFLVIILIVIAIASVDGMKYLSMNELSPELLADWSKRSASNYEYAVLVMDQQSNLEDIDEPLIEEHILSAERTGSRRAYVYMTGSDNIQSEWWEEKELEDSGTKGYDVYLFSNEYQTWVNTELEEEPVPNDIWSMFDVISGYTLLPETNVWYDTGDECFVLQLIGSSDGFDWVYEELYVRCDDYLPVGIIEYCVAEGEENHIEELTQEDFDFVSGDGYHTDSVTAEGKEYKQILRKYSLYFSDEDQILFEKPETFITDQDYMYLTSTYNDDESEDEEEVSDGEETE